MIVIRKCVPRPASSGVGGKTFYLEADVSVGMDPAGMDELRSFMLSGKTFHLVEGEPTKSEAAREQREIDFLRNEGKSLRGYVERADREIAKLRERLFESERRFQLLQQEVVKREEMRSSPLSIGLPPPPGAMVSPKDYRDEITKRLEEYAKGGIIVSPDMVDSYARALVLPRVEPERPEFSNQISYNFSWDPAYSDPVKYLQAAIEPLVFRVAKSFEPAPKKPSDRFGSIEFDEDE